MLKLVTALVMIVACAGLVLSQTTSAVAVSVNSTVTNSIVSTTMPAEFEGKYPMVVAQTQVTMTNAGVVSIDINDKETGELYYNLHHGPSNSTTPLAFSPCRFLTGFSGSLTYNITGTNTTSSIVASTTWTDVGVPVSTSAPTTVKDRVFTNTLPQYLFFELPALNSTQSYRLSFNFTSSSALPFSRVSVSKDSCSETDYIVSSSSPSALARTIITSGGKFFVRLLTTAQDVAFDYQIAATVNASPSPTPSPSPTASFTNSTSPSPSSAVSVAKLSLISAFVGLVLMVFALLF